MKRSEESKAQTPAPRKDRIKGSKTNVKGSAKSRTSARSIKFSDSTLNSIKAKLKEYNAKNPSKKSLYLQQKLLLEGEWVHILHLIDPR